MSHPAPSLLFTIAVVGNLAVILTGALCTVAVSFVRGRIAAAERRAPAHADLAFHHPDPVSTSLFEQLFMLLAAALVLVGLPVALAAIFKFVIPLIGGSSP